MRHLRRFENLDFWPLKTCADPTYNHELYTVYSILTVVYFACCLMMTHWFVAPNQRGKEYKCSYFIGCNLKNTDPKFVDLMIIQQTWSQISRRIWAFRAWWRRRWRLKCASRARRVQSKVCTAPPHAFEFCFTQTSTPISLLFPVLTQINVSI